MLKGKILKLLIVTYFAINYAVANEIKPQTTNCLDIIYSKPNQSLECFKKSDNQYSKIFQSYIYFFDLVEINNNIEKSQILIKEFIENNNQNFLDNWLNANYSAKIMTQNSKNFFIGMNLLSIDLPIKFVRKHQNILLSSYQSYFNDSRDKFLGNIIYDNINLTNLTKLENLLRRINNINNDNISVNRDRNINKIRLLFVPSKEPNFDHNQIKYYLRFWSYFGLWNLKKSHQIEYHKKLAINQLAKYYNKNLKLSKNQSYKISKISLNNYLEQYLGISNNVWSKYYNDPLFKAILNDKSNLSDLIKKYQAKTKSREDRIGLITYINAAIIRNYDLKIISNLIKNIRISNINNEGNFGYISAPLFVAINNLVILEYLLKDWFFNPNQRNSFGKTAIFRAIQENNLNAAKILLKYGAHIDLDTYIFASKKASYLALSTYQRTALIYAAWQGNLEMIEFLIQNGADIYQQDSDGKYAFDYLKRNKKMNISDKTKAKKLLKINSSN